MVIIAISCVELAFDDAGVQPGSVKERLLWVFDIVFTILFGLEVRICLPQNIPSNS